MAKGASTPTRVNADIAAAAAAVAAAENRTVTEQVNYWAGLGMQFERSVSAAGRGVLAAVAGDTQFSTLTPEERARAHNLIDARIAERVATQRFGSTARKAGQVTVSLDDEGHLIEISPDGSRQRR